MMAPDASAQAAAAAAARVAAALEQQMGSNRRPGTTEKGASRSAKAPRDTIESMPVGRMVDVVKAALRTGHGAYAPLAMHRLPSVAPTQVEPGRLQVRLDELERKMKRDEAIQSRRLEREARRMRRREQRYKRRDRRARGLPSRSPSPDDSRLQRSRTEKGAERTERRVRRWSSSRSRSRSISDDDDDTSSTASTSAASADEATSSTLPFRNAPNQAIGGARTDTAFSGTAVGGTIEAASVHKAIDAGNVGHRLLAKMGWERGKGLGAAGKGVAEPINVISQGKTTASSSERRGLGTAQSAVSGGEAGMDASGEGPQFDDAVAAFRNRFSGQYHAHMERRRHERKRS